MDRTQTRQNLVKVRIMPPLPWPPPRAPIVAIRAGIIYSDDCILIDMGQL